MTEIMSQTQDPGHITTAHLGGRFAHLAIERSSLSMIRTRASGRLRFSMRAVAAPENAPPMITTSYSKFIARKGWPLYRSRASAWINADTVVCKLLAQSGRLFLLSPH